ncbi:hypothetical protein A1OE_671 [Candidatus Endolissoclinum faulkneri L2]|uniref:Uncharacterized protein n=1 Tax=Candidatus Endolissoclinum faulkneri L2 TaxID=1193729 RepID=K7YQN4_9PROT|nr:hypothetical protein A1OE_671 [Candidatus Endolissoclinum faulkneri L2]
MAWLLKVTIIFLLKSALYAMYSYTQRVFTRFAYNKTNNLKPKCITLNV